jgi:protein-L-isoaspartate(D-aspartate) O-methyltransferase
MMKSLPSLISHLRDVGVLRTPALIEAFTKIDRIHFVPKNLKNLAYADDPLPIFGGQTISQPFTIAFMLELLAPSKGDKVLDVGSGSGFTTALLAELVGPEGRVIGVEIVPELVSFGRNNLNYYHFANAKIRQSNGAMGLPEEAPFNKILVSASATKIPQILVDQLKRKGNMVVPIGNDIYNIGKNDNNSITTEKYGDFSFVPLIENLHPY